MNYLININNIIVRMLHQLSSPTSIPLCYYLQCPSYTTPVVGSWCLANENVAQLDRGTSARVRLEGARP
jgi:hypothetical protein